MLFADVFDSSQPLPYHLKSQKEQLMAHLKKNPDKYESDFFAEEEDYVKLINDPSNELR